MSSKFRKAPITASTFFEIKDGDNEKFISIEPSKLSLEIDFELKYKNPIIGNQKNKINIYEDDLNDIFNSRTFCLFEDVEKIREICVKNGNPSINVNWIGVEIDCQ